MHQTGNLSKLLRHFVLLFFLHLWHGHFTRPFACTRVELARFQGERCFGIAVDSDACRVHALHLASGSALYTFQCDRLDSRHADLVGQVLNKTSCRKVGVGLAGKLEALLGTFPYLQLESWLDLSEHLWANSITTERLSLEDMSQWLLRRTCTHGKPEKPRAAESPGAWDPDTSDTSETSDTALEATESRDLWPRVEGLVNLRQIQDRLSRGPPSSAVENLWNAAPAAAEADEDAWQAPAQPEHIETVDDWGTDTTAGPTENSVVESPTRLEASQEATEACDNDASNGEAGAEQIEEPADTHEDSEAESLNKDVALWLGHLNLTDHTQAVLAWCEEMGAASLEEVIESIDDLVRELALKPLQEKRLQSKAVEALENVRSREATQANVAGSEPSSAAPGTSYYDGAGTSSSRTGSKETRPVSKAQSFYKSCGQEAEDNYLKQRPTETAVWVPSAKSSQGARKRQKDRTAAANEAQASAQKEAEAEARREAARRLEEQLREEKEQKLRECRALLADALDRTDSQAFATALAAAKKAGLSPEDGKEAQDKLNLALRRRTQRRHDALCALQASLEAPKDEGFGPAVQKALEEAKKEGVLEHVPGGREAARDAEAALHEWEVAEQQRQESRMALQFALRRGEVGALQVALSEAKAAGLADDSGLMAEETLGITTDGQPLDDVQDGDGNLRIVLFSFLALLSTAIFYLAESLSFDTIFEML
ncbi:unnamed protein product [Symbiodinium natans]|uniref:Transmembrane protein n=1 Tax=Symbiodinium natans TaxID=878477 RepID=A0A812S4B6_9DINO|nr:unnamed protein product [Symbiodinium natans]